MKFGKVYLTAEIPDYALDWRNDERVWRWCRQNTLISCDAQDKWLEKISNDPSIKMFGIRSADYDAGNMIDQYQGFIGVCGLTSISLLNRNAEFSLYIAPERQGNGYGKDALKALFTHGFVDFGLKRIWGEVFEGNPAMAIFLSIGMVKEGTLRKSYWKNGHWIDSNIVSMLSSEFVEAQEKW